MHFPKPYRICDTKHSIAILGIKTQQLIAKCYDLGLLEEARLFWKVDAGLWNIYHNALTRHAGSRHMGGDAYSCFDRHSMHIDAHKQNGYAAREADRRHMTGESFGYVWRSQDDSKVRSSHAENDDQEFSWDHPPASGHPGEDFNCRCWAEPIGDSFYASQLLISKVNDNPKKWTNGDFAKRYWSGAGGEVSLQKTGYLGEIIEYYKYHAVSKNDPDEKPGIYKRVSMQVIGAALEKGVGRLSYTFDGNYNFYDVLYTFRNSTVEGSFDGDVRKEKGFLVISGLINYKFIDKFKDPLSFVEALQRYFGMDRREAEAFVGESGDFSGKVYSITDSWQTKFNATVRIAR